VWNCPKCREQVEENFEVCWSCGTAKDGSEDPSFRRADDAVAEAPAAADISSAGVELQPEPDRQQAVFGPPRCPSCGRGHIRADGWAGRDVRVQFGSSWMGPFNYGYRVQCFACLDCGFVGLYLNSDDVRALKES